MNSSALLRGQKRQRAMRSPFSRPRCSIKCAVMCQNCACSIESPGNWNLEQVFGRPNFGLSGAACAWKWWLTSGAALLRPLGCAAAAGAHLFRSAAPVSWTLLSMQTTAVRRGCNYSKRTFLCSRDAKPDLYAMRVCSQLARQAVVALIIALLIGAGNLPM